MTDACTADAAGTTDAARDITTTTTIAAATSDIPTPTTTATSAILSQASAMLRAAEKGRPVYLCADCTDEHNDNTARDGDSLLQNRLYVLLHDDTPPQDRPSVVAAPGDAPEVVANRLLRLVDLKHQTDR